MTIKALNSGILSAAMAISGAGNVRSVRARSIQRERSSGQRVYTWEDGSFTLWLSGVTAGEAATIQAYCDRQGQEAPALLAFYQPSRESSKADQSASGWLAKVDPETGEEVVAFRLEYRADGCTVERDGPIYRVVSKGREKMRFGAFSISDGRLARWANVKGSPLQSALRESKEEKAERVQEERTDRLSSIQAGMLKAVQALRADGAQAEELAGIYPAGIISQVFADLAQEDQEVAAK